MLREVLFLLSKISCLSFRAEILLLVDCVIILVLGAEVNKSSTGKLVFLLVEEAISAVNVGGGGDADDEDSSFNLF